MALSLTYSPISGLTTPVYPVYNDQTHIIKSDKINRPSFHLLTDVYLDNEKFGTLKTFPFRNHIEVNPTNLTSTYVENEFNYDTNRCEIDVNSLRKVNLYIKETYSRKIRFSSITDSFGYAQLNFDAITNLRVNDRILIKKDDSSFNQEYNTYAKVLGVSSNSILTDLYYLTPPFSSATETGYAYEGVEYFDYTYINGNPNIVTTNPHNFNVGDQIFLQMDTWAIGVIELISVTSTATTITQIRTNGVDIITNPIPYTTDLPTTAQLIADEINNTTSVPEYTAYHYSGDNRVFVYSRREDGAEKAASSGNSFFINTTGGFLGFILAPFHINQGIDATNTGWNPQFTGNYTITEVTSPTSFRANLPDLYYSNPPGTERGSIYSLNNYINESGITTDYYYVLNASNLYDTFNYQSFIDKYVTRNVNSNFLTNRPRNTFYFSDDYDISNLEILYNTSGKTTGNTVVKNMVVFTFDEPNATVPTGIYNVRLGDILSPLSANSEYHKLTFGVGPYNLNQIDYANISPTPTGATFIDGNVDNYVIELIADDNFTIFSKVVSEQIRFKRKSSNGRKYYTIIFLNRFGSYEYYNIYTNLNETQNFDRQLYERKAEKYYSDSDYGVRPDNRGVGSTGVFTTRNITLFTDWLKQDESIWLSQIFQSPDVYLYVVDDGLVNYNQNLFPIVITDTEVNIPNERSSLKQYQFNAILSPRIISQKG